MYSIVIHPLCESVETAATVPLQCDYIIHKNKNQHYSKKENIYICIKQSCRHFVSSSYY